MQNNVVGRLKLLKKLSLTSGLLRYKEYPKLRLASTKVKIHATELKRMQKKTNSGEWFKVKRAVAAPLASK